MDEKEFKDISRYDGNKIIHSRYGVEEFADNDSCDYYNDYEKLMSIVDRIKKDDGHWVNILGPFVTIGLSGEHKTLIAIHPNGIDNTRYSIWLGIIKFIQHINNTK
jgi:hypothetical protein